jgi:hypothetical protein
MTALAPVAVAPEQPVLAGLVDDTEIGWAGCFADDVWDLTPLLVRRRSAQRLYFADVPTAFRAPVKEFAWLALRTPAPVRKARPRLDPSTVIGEVHQLRRLCVWLVEHDVHCFADVSQQLLDDHLAARRQVICPTTLRSLVKSVQRCAAYSPAFSEPAHRFSIVPWRGRPTPVVAGSARRGGENLTARIPEQVMAPLLRVALLYVEQFAADILTARAEASRLPPRADRRHVPAFEQLAAVETEIARRRQHGHGIPVRDDGTAHIWALLRSAGVYPGTNGIAAGVRRQAADALAELGPTPPALTATPSTLEDTGRPWRDPFPLGGVALDWEATRLGWACTIVIAYLSGMRPSELVNLRRGCAVVDRNPDGSVRRHKLRGVAYKGRRATGRPAVWVVLPVVHQAVNVLRGLRDAPDDTLLLPSLTTSSQLQRFVAYSNRLFGHIPALHIPDVDGDPWPLSFLQLRRTLAWHIRNRPFGHVAGAIQYQHAQVTMFEGYAGTSASGFQQEVEAEREAANLAELFDLVVGTLQGDGLAGRGADRLRRRISEIDSDLGGLAGVVADQQRVKAMLRSEARTLHPALLNDCFFDPAVAKCLTGVPDEQRHAPLPSRCEPLRCPNAVITTKHAPVWLDEHTRIVELLAKDRHLPEQQRQVLEARQRQVDQIITVVGTKT